MCGHGNGVTWNTHQNDLCLRNHLRLLLYTPRTHSMKRGILSRQPSAVCFFTYCLTCLSQDHPPSNDSF